MSALTGVLLAMSAMPWVMIAIVCVLIGDRNREAGRALLFERCRRVGFDRGDCIVHRRCARRRRRLREGGTVERQNGG